MNSCWHGSSSIKVLRFSGIPITMLPLYDRSSWWSTLSWSFQHVHYTCNLSYNNNSSKILSRKYCRRYCGFPLKFWISCHTVLCMLPWHSMNICCLYICRLNTQVSLQQQEVHCDKSGNVVIWLVPLIEFLPLQIIKWC